MSEPTPITVAILLYPDVTQLDFTGPAQVLSRMGNTTIMLIAKTLDPIPTDSGFAIHPTHRLDQVSEATILCVPGGFGVTAALEEPEMIAWPRAIAAKAEWVTSVCTGALLLGARLGAARTAAITAVSPALWTSSGAAAPGAFDGADDYEANSVWGLPELNSIPIRIDCGDSDPFYSATKQFVAQLANPPAGGFSPAGHDGAYWSSQLPGEVAWMAPLLVA